MAAYKAIVPLLRADIRDALEAVTLGMYTSQPFRMREERDRVTKPIAELAGGEARIWEMGEPTERRQITMGSPQRKWEFVFPIRVPYPANDPRWLLALDDDTDNIYDYLTSNNSTVSGVDIREPRFDAWPPETEYLEEPNWAIRTIPLYVVMEIS